MRWVLIVVGAALMAWSFFFDVSVTTGDYQSVVNLGLIAQKQALFGLGAVLFVSGVVLIGANRVVQALKPAPAEPEGEISPALSNLYGKPVRKAAS